MLYIHKVVPDLYIRDFYVVPNEKFVIMCITYCTVHLRCSVDVSSGNIRERCGCMLLFVNSMSYVSYEFHCTRALYVFLSTDVYLLYLSVYETFTLERALYVRVFRYCNDYCPDIMGTGLFRMLELYYS